MKKIRCIFLAFLFAVAVFWFWYPIRSLTVMSVYSAIHRQSSIMTEKGFDISIPGGISTAKRDWYPFVITYNADSFKARGGEINGMTILYNFPAFNPISRTNSFYEIDCPFSSSFYGAYIIKAAGPVPYCFNKDKSVNFDEVMDAFSYDYKALVLESFSDFEFVFSVKEYDTIQSDYIGYSGWEKVDAKIYTNSVSHSFKGSKRSYIQYGRPLKNATIEFPETTMCGRLYIKYFPEISSTVIMYAMAPDPNVIQDCDELILSKSTIKFGKE